MGRSAMAPTMLAPKAMASKAMFPTALTVAALALAALLLGGPPAQARMADKPAAAPVKLDQKALDRGMKEAPAVQQASGAACTVSAAAFRGDGSQKGPDGKPQKVSIYETACTGALGYLLIAPAGGKPQPFDCLAVKGSPTECALPQNADPKPGLAALMTKAGKSCAVSDGKYVGTSTKDGTTYYEVACGAQPGYRLSAPSGSAAPEAIACADLMDTPNACALTTKAMIVASVTQAVQGSGRTCQVSDVRLMGQSTKSTDVFWEVGCGTQPGYVAMLDATGKLKQTIDCAKADTLGGGCKLTDTTVAATAENAIYSKLATKAGFPCQVSKYRYIGMSDKREVVELACSNRPDGALAVLADPGQSDIYDCVRAGKFDQSCKLTSASVVYPKYTDALAAKGKTSCKVSGAGYLGTSQTGEQYVETACADGNPGWVIGFTGPSYDAKEVLTCRQATNSGLPCKLPTNATANK